MEVVRGGGSIASRRYLPAVGLKSVEALTRLFKRSDDVVKKEVRWREGDPTCGKRPVFEAVVGSGGEKRDGKAAYAGWAVVRPWTTWQRLSAASSLCGSTILRPEGRFRLHLAQWKNACDTTRRATRQFGTCSEDKDFPSRPVTRRFGKFKKVEQRHVDEFASFLRSPSDQLMVADNLNSEEASVIKSHFVDWMGVFETEPVDGSKAVVLLPENVVELQKILRYCNKEALAVCLQGGNTGLVQGSVPVFDEIVVNMARMNRILDFHPGTGILTCEAGCILESLSHFLEKQDPPRIAPLDLGAKGSCHIGGNVATNAGGIRYLRYGSLHGNVLGLEAILADGSILDCLSTLKKDSTGPKLHHLFIGSEGCFGAISKINLQCPLAPRKVNLGLMKCDTFSHVLRATQKIRASLSEMLSALEVMENNAMKQVVSTFPNARIVFSDDSSLSTRSEVQDEVTPSCFYVLAETHSQSEDADGDRLEGVMEDLLESGIITDASLAANETQMKEMWFLRENIAAAATHQGKSLKYDITVPLEAMFDPVVMTRQRLREKLPEAKYDTIGYGHLGDCNLHLNVLVRSSDALPAVEKCIEPWIHQYVQSVQGSISAEHGLGTAKSYLLPAIKPPKTVKMIRSLKSLFDPNGILNPYKVVVEDLST